MFHDFVIKYLYINIDCWLFGIAVMDSMIKNLLTIYLAFPKEYEIGLHNKYKKK